MLQLVDFFEPLSIKIIFYLIIFLITFDSVGNLLTRLFLGDNKDSKVRLINWIIGWGFFIFIWFLLGFYVEPTRDIVLLSIGGLLLLSLPSYLKNKCWKLTLKSWYRNTPVLILFFLLLPLVYVQASRPPVEWDEMAYHFISPASLSNLSYFWNFSGYLYLDVPRTLNLYYILSFLVTRTYSIARLTNFLILLTAITYTYNVLKEKINVVVAVFFVFALLSIPQVLIKSATSGYVDIPTNSLVLMAVVSGIAVLLSPTRKSIMLTVVFWSLAFGMKYSALIPFISMLAPLILAMAVFKKKQFKKFFKVKLLVTALILFVVYGGYWYIKNAYLYSNPVFPFIFNCRSPFDMQCGKGSAFFSSWTTPIKLNTFFPILKELLQNNISLIALSLMTPFFAIFNTNKRTKLATIVLGVVVIIEFILLANFSGFHFRYHQHLQFILILLISIQIGNKYSSSIIGRISKVALIISVVILVPYYFYSIFFNYFNVSFRQEASYALGRASIYQWIEWRMPKVASVVRWCDNQNTGEQIDIVQHDPDMIWYSYDGLVRVFLTNCRIAGFPFNDKSLVETEEIIKNEDKNFYLISLNDCIDEDKVKTKHENENDEKLLMRKRNNMLVCKGDKIVESLYYIDF